jgi:hypothetical protein
MTKYILSKPNTGPMAEIIVADDEMIVYDVCKIADYEGNDYVPRKAKEMDHHALHEMFNQKEEATEDGG